MINFLTDLKDYPTAIIDDQTTNKSWVYLASLLKQMGIKNHFFHLSLMQSDLQGIDPFSPNLTPEIMLKIKIECEYNPWYFFREIFYLPDGNNKKRFNLNRGNMFLIWSFFNTVDAALEMIRQTGKSVTCDGILIYLLFFYYRRTEILLVTQDTGLRKTTINRIKNTRDLLPFYLNLHNSKTDLDNMEAISCDAYKNILRTRVGQPQSAIANNIGRGGTFPVIHFDECATTPNIDISMPAAIKACSAARENKEETNMFYGNIFTTTSGKLNSKEGSYIYNFFTSGTTWTEKLYDCTDRKDLKNTISKNNPDGRVLVYGSFNHRQVGKTDAWLKNRIILSKDTPDQTARDWLGIWTSGSESGAIEGALLEVINKTISDPLYVEITKERYIIRWYIEEKHIAERMSETNYIIGLDTSELIGKDANGLVITDIRDMSVVATCRVSESSLHKYAVWLGMFLVAYSKTILVIEKKSSAQGIIDTIVTILINYGQDPFKRIYNRIPDQKEIYNDEYTVIQKPLSIRDKTIYEKYKMYFGFNTGKSSRNFLYGTVFNEAISGTGHLIKDSSIINELNGLVEKNGRIDHSDGGHDDLVIAFLLCHYFIKHTKNLQHYDINTRECLSKLSANGVTVTEDELINKHKIAIINTEINELKQKLAASYSIVESARLTKMLEYKIKQSNELGDSVLSLDKILSEIYNNKPYNQSLRKSLNKQRYENFFKY